MKTEELYIVLGCFGRRDDDFVSCAGVENRILKTDESLFNYNELMDYLDTCRLFDRPIFDYNAIRHFIFYVRDKFDQPMKRLWSEKKFELYQKFIIDHRHCGLYVKLVMVSPELASPPEEPKGIMIPGGKQPEQTQVHGLKVIRGRK
ncbi:MAG TPA: hypothetical protein VM577_09150 [Anaerovoracaceae bacterium]|nr:hypothetical protein [Anaerovoracaceae bacterium]